MFNTDLGEIQDTSFPHNAVETGEVLGIGLMKTMLYLMAQWKFFPCFLDVSANLAKIRHKMSKKYSKWL